MGSLKKTLSLFILGSIFLMTGCTYNKIIDDYPSLDKKTIIEYVQIDEVFSKLDSNVHEKNIIVFGFKSCQWCQAAVYYIDLIAKEKNYQKVMYLDIKEMRDNENDKNHQKYLDLYNLIKDSIGNPIKIYAPTVIVVENGIITGYHEGTTSDHEKIDGILPPMTDEQIDTLKSSYRKIF